MNGDARVGLVFLGFVLLVLGIGLALGVKAAIIAAGALLLLIGKLAR